MLDLLLKFLLLLLLFLPVEGFLDLVHHVLIDVSLKLHILIFAQQVPGRVQLHMVFRTHPALLKDLVYHINSTIAHIFGFLVMVGMEVREEGLHSRLTILFCLLIVIIKYLIS